MIHLFLSRYPWIVWLALGVFLGGVIFLILARRRRKISHPPAIIPAIPNGARKVETVVDITMPGITRTIVTIDYLDGFPTSPDSSRKSLFQEAMHLMKSQQFRKALVIFDELSEKPRSPVKGKIRRRGAKATSIIAE